MANGESYSSLAVSDSVSMSTFSSKMKSGKRCLKKISVEPVLFLCVASAVFKFVILPQFLLNSICNRLFNSTVCKNLSVPSNSDKQAHVQASTAKWMLGLYTFSLSISLFTVPILGSIADRFSAKKALSIPIIMFNLQSITYAVISLKWREINPGYLFFCIGLGGISGDMVGLLMLTCSYLSAITTEEQRTFRLTLLDGILTLSICVFTFSSGFIIATFGYSTSFWFSVAIDIASLIWLIFLVPSDVKKESKKCSNGEADLAKEPEAVKVGQTLSNAFEDGTKNGKKDGKAKMAHVDKEGENATSKGLKDSADVFDHSNQHSSSNKETEVQLREGKIEPNGHVEEAVTMKVRQILVELNPISRFKKLKEIIKEQGDYKTMMALLAAHFISSMCVIGESLILVLYMTNHPYNMNPVDIGYLLSLQNLLRFFAGCVLVNIVIQRLFKWQDIHIVIASLFLGSIYFILLGSATSTKMLFAIQIMSIFGPLATPTLRSIITKKGGPENYGAILSVALTMDAVASIVANIVVHTTYASLVENNPGVFCFILSGLSAFAACTGILAKKFGKDVHDDQSERH